MTKTCLYASSQDEEIFTARILREYTRLAKQTLMESRGILSNFFVDPEFKSLCPFEVFTEETRQSLLTDLRLRIYDQFVRQRSDITRQVSQNVDEGLKSLEVKLQNEDELMAVPSTLGTTFVPVMLRSFEGVELATESHLRSIDYEIDSEFKKLDIQRQKITHKQETFQKSFDQSIENAGSKCIKLLE